MHQPRLHASRLTSVLILSLAPACMTVAMAAAAPDYPSRPVRIIVPFPPGGSNDIVGRVVATQLSERMGKPFVADNRAGGNSIIGTELAANAPPDGHTLLIISTSFTTNPVIHKLPFDPLKSFAWVAMLGVGPNVLVVTPSFPANTVKQLIALAKARPGQIVYASTGVGSNAHFGTEMLKSMTGIDMVHVPYKGGALALIDTMAGQTQLCMGSLIQATAHIRNGKLKALATTGGKRSPILPEVPTMIEAGVPGYETVNWWGLVAPAGTPEAIVNRLNAEIAVIMKNPEVEKRLVSEGAEPALLSPAELGQRVAGEIAKWQRVAKQANIRGE